MITIYLVILKPYTVESPGSLQKLFSSLTPARLMDRLNECIMKRRLREADLVLEDGMGTERK